jgi:hypothetical protein
VKTALFMVAILLFVPPTASMARGHGGSDSGRYIRGFTTSHCKSASCFRKHPDGKYIHPLTTRKHR